MSVSGEGDVEMTANTTLKANSSGSGSVRYKGQPTINLSGSGSGQLINSN